APRAPTAPGTRRRPGWPSGCPCRSPPTGWATGRTPTCVRRTARTGPGRTASPPAARSSSAPTGSSRGGPRARSPTRPGCCGRSSGRSSTGTDRAAAGRASAPDAPLPPPLRLGLVLLEALHRGPVDVPRPRGDGALQHLEDVVRVGGPPGRAQRVRQHVEVGLGRRVLEEARLGPQAGGLFEGGRDLPALPQLARRHGPHPALCEQPLVLPDGGRDLDRRAGRVRGDAGADDVDEVQHGGARTALLRRQV